MLLLVYSYLILFIPVMYQSRVADNEAFDLILCNFFCPFCLQTEKKEKSLYKFHSQNCLFILLLENLTVLFIVILKFFHMQFYLNV